MNFLKAQTKARQVHFPIPRFRKNVVWIGIFCFMFASAVIARENNWQLTLANGDTISSVVFQRLEGDSLAISFAITDTTIMKWIAVESIVELRKVKKSKFWKGAGIGFVTGTAVGALIGWATYEDLGFVGTPGMMAEAYGMLGAPVGFLLGGIIGSSSGKDEIYDFSQMSHQHKLRILGWLVSNQK